MSWCLARRFATAVSAVLVLGSCGGEGTSGDQQRLADAETFRVNLVNVTGQHHLSISDYATIRDEVCGGAIGPSELVEIAQQWGLDRTTSDAEAANTLWDSAKDRCREAFDAGDGNDLEPFASTGGSPQRIDDPNVDVAFLDVSIFDQADWQPDNGQLQLIGESKLTATETVEHFSSDIGGDWEVLEVVGPFGASMEMWSLDISDGTASGVINVYDRIEPSALTGDRSAVIVQVVLVDVNYPLG